MNRRVNLFAALVLCLVFALPSIDAQTVAKDSKVDPWWKHAVSWC